MAVESPSTFEEVLTLVLMFGGADRGGDGIGITGGGKIRKIPPRQDFAAMSTEQRDERILEAVEILAQGLQNGGMRAAIERASGEAKEMAAR
ncbi:MAG TPA: hypothetical protein VG318_15290 [Actinomycetota bacterium]|nr:hypothetical protein [Actinomycetota bacterium]